MKIIRWVSTNSSEASVCDIFTTHQYDSALQHNGSERLSEKYKQYQSATLNNEKFYILTDIMLWETVRSHVMQPFSRSFFPQIARKYSYSCAIHAACSYAEYFSDSF